MSNREENLKKINAELEMMSDEELEKVSGGATKEEVEEHFREWLKNFGPAISDLTNMHKDDKTSKS